MRHPTMLSLEEAEGRASRSVRELEEVINRVDGTPGKRDEDRQAKLNSLFMTFLAEIYGIAAPDSTGDEVDSKL